MEQNNLQNAIDEITDIAAGFGLDFYSMRYEICPADIIYTFGAYGMPARFSHWRFGKRFYKMKLQYEMGLSKIYELVINTDPCSAFLLNTNSLIQNKLIIAHVLAHSDFFKNNAHFKKTNRQMETAMGAAAERIQELTDEYGIDRVEPFLDAVLSIEEHVDPNGDIGGADSKPSLPKKHLYDDLWERTDDEQVTEELFREKDMLKFIAEKSTVLEDWQREVIMIVRSEMLYFWPQMETKIMNEGWASYWHMRIMRELDLPESEAIEYARLNAEVVQPSKMGMNPYYVGVKLYEHIEQQFGSREKLFDVRAMESDISFLRNYMTKDFVEKEEMYLFEKKGSHWTITEKDWEKIRDHLTSSKINGGFPHLCVTDGDYLKSGELYIIHSFEGVELDLGYLEHTMPHIYTLWGKPIHIETVVDGRIVVFSYGKDGVKRKYGKTV
ncbi:SpoVR family protein [Domibacillus epiphyticus]|uniref:Stage V sporulation protein R n=1 Tax=Domibacillus epiphyticus TaxID=1714355 RepID=A0A1V2A837_9BACI|nr:SpoVR family protein [Domibacillus epiphyticus]OMP67158.1 stage V sporulation protein R [Domibacillus epiphyticus]